ncbi:gamma-glutamyltransferase [Staphylococcus argenteus]|uniref:gamma-glutamyltransferase n=1 Tax=Staphylococcus argenteus TaxID=985002 RepID=UPI0010DA880A|nr:gamma-glutamyltransferase [Staphylococcus argenteus]BCR31780.1 gamma-glutamyltransferase [Staphylococcus argenteus]GBU01792.1 gamma-glutamyltranspeptidase [Staphylococcus argenteus]
MVINLNDKQKTTSKEGLISVSHPLAAKIGKGVLDKGGNAMDAVIAIQLALNVVEPFASGIGGGGYLLYYEQSTGSITAFDAREAAPAHIDQEFYLNDSGEYKSFFDMTTHGKTVAVPAIPKLFDYIHKHYAKLSLEELINPAIELAMEGHSANWATEKYSRQQHARLTKYHETAQVFTNENRYWREDDWIVQPEIGKTFQILKEHGFNAFYKGDIAEKLVNIVKKYGGTITLEDLAKYDIQIKTPISATFKDYDIYSMGPSSSGGIAVIQILKLLEHVDLHSMGARSVDYLHYLIQAMHLAYSDRAQFLADDNFHDVPVESLIDDDYLNTRSKLIDSDKANIDIEHGAISDCISHTDVDENHTETTHFCVIDKEGNIASFTTSIGMIYGSGITIPGYGVLLNTTMDGFDVVAGGINEIASYKRPLSNMAPTIVTHHGKPILTVGAPGAISIIASVAQTLINVLVFGMDIQQAIDEPRIYSSHPNRIEWEPQFSQSTILALIARGHAMESKPDAYIGDVHGLQVDSNTREASGGADDTREGTVMGGDVLTIRKQPLPISNMYDNDAYHVYFNNVQLPLLADQVRWMHDKCWIEESVVRIILSGVSAHVEDLRSYEIAGENYIDIAWLARKKGYQVTLKDDSLYLSDESYHSVKRNTNAYYRYDRDSITR